MGWGGVGWGGVGWGVELGSIKRARLGDRLSLSGLAQACHETRRGERVAAAFCLPTTMDGIDGTILLRAEVHWDQGPQVLFYYMSGKQAGARCSLPLLPCTAGDVVWAAFLKAGRPRRQTLERAALAARKAPVRSQVPAPRAGTGHLYAEMVPVINGLSFGIRIPRLPKLPKQAAEPVLRACPSQIALG